MRAPPPNRSHYSDMEMYSTCPREEEAARCALIVKPPVDEATAVP